MNAMGDPTENQGATYSQGMGGEPLGPTGKSHAALNNQPQRVSGALWLLPLGKANPDWSLAIQTTGFLVPPASLPPQAFIQAWEPRKSAHEGIYLAKETEEGDC